MSPPVKVDVQIVNINVFENACKACGFETEMLENDTLNFTRDDLYRTSTVSWNEEKNSYEIHSDSDDINKIKSELYPMYSALQIEHDMKGNMNFDMSSFTINRLANNNVVVEVEAY